MFFLSLASFWQSSARTVLCSSSNHSCMAFSCFPLLRLCLPVALQVIFWTSSRSNSSLFFGLTFTRLLKSSQASSLLSCRLFVSERVRNWSRPLMSTSTTSAKLLREYSDMRACSLQAAPQSKKVNLWLKIIVFPFFFQLSLLLLHLFFFTFHLLHVSLVLLVCVCNCAFSHAHPLADSFLPNGKGVIFTIGICPCARPSCFSCHSCPWYLLRLCYLDWEYLSFGRKTLLSLFVAPFPDRELFGSIISLAQFHHFHDVIGHDLGPAVFCQLRRHSSCQPRRYLSSLHPST